MNNSFKLIRYLWAVLIFIVIFCIGIVHHKWFYPLEFHGDSAAMHVLAKAILKEGSLLPRDFSYGNQLILFRSSPFIALAILAGFKNYDAFVLGSSLSIAFWGGILFIFLNLIFKSWKKAITIGLCLLIPFGHWDSDFTLGQQSHISNVVLSLGVAITSYKYLEEKDLKYIFLTCTCCFLIVAESPIRGLLVLAPLCFVIPLISIDKRKIFFITITLFLTTLLGFVANKWMLLYRPITVNYFKTLTFKSSGEIVDNIGKTSLETLASLTSLNVFSGSRISLLGGAIFSLALLVIIFYFLFLFVGILKLNNAVKLRLTIISSPEKSFNEGGINFLHILSLSGLFVGALSVAALNPDSSRHYLWVFFLGKLVIITWIYNLSRNFFGEKYSAIFVLAFSLLVSMWSANFVKWRWNLGGEVKSRIHSSLINDIQLAIEKTGIRHIYGEDFWRMMPLNSIADGLNSQSLLYDGSVIRPFNWLTPPSWSCTDKDVLYYLKDGVVDRAIEEKLNQSAGKKIISGINYSIWVGPRVWQHSSGKGCYENHLFYDGRSLSSLPNLVGVSKFGERVSDGRAGFLAFGPHAPFKKGTYELTVYGSSKPSNGSYIEVVSNGGNILHARFDIQNTNSKSLLENGLVNISDNVEDIEVRIWSGENDSLILSGYELRKKEAGH